MPTVFGSILSTAAPPPTELKYPAVVMRCHLMVVSYSLLDQMMMMMMMIVLRWKISKSKVVVLEKGGVCNQEEGVVDVDLVEGVAEVDVGLSVKQCVEWDGRDTSGITQDQLILNGPWQRKSKALNYFWLYFAIFIYWNESFLHLYNVFRNFTKSLWLKSLNLQMYKTFYRKIYLKIEQ